MWENSPRSYYGDTPFESSPFETSYRDEEPAAEDENLYQMSRIEGSGMGSSRRLARRRLYKKVGAGVCLLVAALVGISLMVGGSGGGDSGSTTPAATTNNSKKSSTPPPPLSNNPYAPPPEMLDPPRHDGPMHPTEVDKEEATDLVILRRAEFLQVLEPLYDQYNLDISLLHKPDDNSPQQLAFAFITDTQAYPLLSPRKRLERFALACFYYSTYRQSNPYTPQPSDWSSEHQWMLHYDVCVWQGVYCHVEENGHVWEIRLGSNRLSGGLPMELVLIQELKVIWLPNNFLHVSSHDARLFGLLPRLEVLDLNDNYVEYVDRLPSNVSHVALSYNLMEDFAIYDWPALTHLEVESNFLTKLDGVNELPSIEYLYVRRNQLELQLPDWILPLRMATTVWLDENNVTGTLPDLTDSNLVSLSIASTQLTGTIPALPTSLQRLWLYENALTGSIPDQVASLSHLRVLDIHANLLTGVVPNVACTNIAKYNKRSQIVVDCARVACVCCNCTV